MQGKMLLPESHDLVCQILDAAADGMAVAELEYLGLSLRVINSLEESKYQIVYLEELTDFTEEELLEIPSLGPGGIKQIRTALEKFGQLESEKHRWEKGSDRTEYYKKNIKRETVLTFTN